MAKRITNNTEEARNAVVANGTFDSWLLAPLSVENISGADAKRVPEVVQSLLKEHDAEIDFVKWGGGEGLEDYRGKVVAKWKAPREYNAVNYANMVKRMFESAANAFVKGSRVLFSHYVILPRNICPWCDEIKVYANASMKPTQPGFQQPGFPVLNKDGSNSGGGDKRKPGMSNTTKYIIIGSGSAVVVGWLWWKLNQRSEAVR